MDFEPPIEEAQHEVTLASTPHKGGKINGETLDKSQEGWVRNSDSALQEGP